MKKYIAPVSFGFAIILASTTAFSGTPYRASAQTTGCYQYAPQTGSTFITTLTTSAGQSQTVTLPAQNPPSILQPMTFNATDSSCALWFETDLGPKWELLDGSFVTNNSSVKFASSPLQLNLASTYLVPSWNNTYGWLSQANYAGASDLNTGSASIANEDAVINAIGGASQITLKFAGHPDNRDYGNATEFSFLQSAGWLGSLDYTQQTSIPATNCVSLGGNGPNKIVFMRGDLTNSNIGDYMAWANASINQGFKSIDPYKGYINQFSFYLDLKKVPESSLSKTKDQNGNSAFSQAAATYVKSSSSCSSNAKAYVFFSGDASTYPAITQDNVSFIQPKIFNNLSLGTAGNVGFPDTVVHEVSHAIADLKDEYLAGSTFSGSVGDENCAHNPTAQYKNDADGKIYAGLVPGDSNGGESFYTGCTVLSDAGGTLYRPSRVSIMNSGNLYIPKFNVISCGYVISAILGEPVDKAHAQTHWPECFNSLDTRKTEVAAARAAPTINAVTPVTGSKNTFSAAGSGFSTTGNSVKLTPMKSALLVHPTNGIEWLIGRFPIANAQTTSSYYEIDNIASADGTTLRFSVPATVPDGTYTVSLSGLNSPWTDTSYSVTISGNGAGDPTTAIGGPSAGTTPGLQGTIAASVRYSCPANAGYDALQIAGSCHKSEVPATTVDVIWLNYGMTMTCPNGDGSLASWNNNLGKWVCNMPAVPASTIPATVSYYCPTGYTLSGSVCNISSNYTPPTTTHTITPSAGANGSISPSTTTTVSYNGEQIFTITPANGYQVNTVTVDGTFVGAIPTYTFSNVELNHTINATFSAIQVTTVPTTPPGATSTPAVPNYSCGAGYALQPDHSCYRAPSATIPTIAATPAYACPSTDYVLTSTSTCYRGPSAVPATVPANVLYGCPAGYNLSGSTCTKPATTVTTPAQTIGASVSYDCNGFPSGTTYNDYSHTCNNGYGSHPANATYSCPAGATLSGTSCYIPASTVTTPAISVPGTPSYLCNTGYTLSGSTCNVTVSASTVASTVSYACPTGYTLSGSTCNVTVTASTLASYVTYTCPNGFTPIGPTCYINTAPASLVATAGSDADVKTISLSWDNNSVANISRISIERATSTYGVYTVIGNVTNPGTSYDDTNLASGKTFYYRIRAQFNNGAYGDYSPIAYAMTQVMTKIIGLTGTPGANAQVNLSWTDGTSEDVAGISVERQLPGIGGIPWTQIAILNPTATAYSDAGLIASTTYRYRARMLLSDGTYGTYSSWVMIKTSGPLGAPTVAISNITPTSLEVSLTGLSDPNIAYFAVSSIASTTGSTTSTVIATTTNTSAVITNLIPSTQYCYSARAIVSLVNAGDASTIVCATTTAPVAPISLTSSATALGEINLAWNNNNAKGFDGVSIERATAKNGPYMQITIASSTSTSFIDIRLPSTTTFYYNIRLKYGPLYSAYAATSTVTTLTPAIPVLTVSPTSTSTLTLAWTDNDAGVNSFSMLSLPGDKVSATTTFAVSASTTRTYVATGLMASTRYCFVVQANVNPVNMATSTAACATTATLVAPTSLSSSNATQGQAKLSWSDNGIASAPISIERFAGVPTGTSIFTVIATTTPGATAYADVGLPAGAAYAYRIRFWYPQSGLYSSYAATSTVTTAKPSVPVLSSAAAAGSTGVKLTWTDNDSDIASFSILGIPARAETATTTIASVSSSTNSYVATGLMPSTRYCFAVQANVNPVNMATSAAVCATTAALGAPTSLTSSVTTQGKINLSWSNNGVTGYDSISVERANSKNGPYGQIFPIIPFAVGSTTYTDVGLPANLTQYYNVRFNYGTLGYGPYTATTSATTLTPVAPTSVTASATTATSTLISWTDNDSGILTYIVTQISPKPNTFTASEKSFTVQNLAPSTTYCFSVNAVVNRVNISATSTRTCVTMKASSAAPKAPSAAVPTPTPNPLNQLNASVSCRLANAAGGAKTLTVSGSISGAASPYALKATNGAHTILFSPVSAGATFSNTLTLSSYDESSPTTFTVTSADGKTKTLTCATGSTSVEANVWDAIINLF